MNTFTSSDDSSFGCYTSPFKKACFDDLLDKETVNNEVPYSSGKPPRGIWSSDSSDPSITNDSEEVGLFKTPKPDTNAFKLLRNPIDRVKYLDGASPIIPKKTFAKVNKGKPPGKKKTAVSKKPPTKKKSLAIKEKIPDFSEFDNYELLVERRQPYPPNIQRNFEISTPVSNQQCDNDLVNVCDENIETSPVSSKPGSPTLNSPIQNNFPLETENVDECYGKFPFFHTSTPRSPSKSPSKLVPPSDGVEVQKNLTNQTCLNVNNKCTTDSTRDPLINIKNRNSIKRRRSLRCIVLSRVRNEKDLRSIQIPPSSSSSEELEEEQDDPGIISPFSSSVSESSETETDDVVSSDYGDPYVLEPVVENVEFEVTSAFRRTPPVLTKVIPIDVPVKRNASSKKTKVISANGNNILKATESAFKTDSALKDIDPLTAKPKMKSCSSSKEETSLKSALPCFKNTTSTPYTQTTSFVQMDEEKSTKSDSSSKDKANSHVNSRKMSLIVSLERLDENTILEAISPKSKSSTKEPIMPRQNVLERRCKRKADQDVAVNGTVLDLVKDDKQSKTEMNEPSSIEMSYQDAWDTFIETTTEEKILKICQQENVLLLDTLFGEKELATAKKIGEGSFAEVFKIKCKNEFVVLKIVPVDRIFASGSKQLTLHEVLSEIIISKEINSLSSNVENRAPIFIKVKEISYAEGIFPFKLLQEWAIFASKRDDAINDDPGQFDDNQRYIVFRYAYGGTDLEHFEFSKASEITSVIKQLSVGLAVAEQSCNFEHRDLHEGNILVSKTRRKFSDFLLEGKLIKVLTNGCDVKVIDFTLSRLEKDETPIYKDLDDSELFTGTGDEQFDVYRAMRDQTKKEWDKFKPVTNILWLSFLMKRMCDRHKNLFKQDDASSNRMARYLTGIENCKSAKEFVYKVFKDI